MEDKFNIDDSIVLNPKGGKINNIKKILTAIAILVVLFLIILILMRFINSEDVNTDVDLMLPAEQKIDENLNLLNKEAKKVTIKNTSSIKNDEKAIKDTENKPAEHKVKDTPSVAKQEIVIVSSKKAEEEARKAAEAKKAEELKKLEEAKKAEEARKAAEAKKIAEAKKAEELKKLEEAKKAEEARKAAEAKKIKKGLLLKSSMPKGDYIQVLAVSTYKPDANYIKKLTGAGYDYRLHKVQVSGKEFTKILVGPYSSNQLQRELSNIRATINKNAFKYTVK
ncbi:hypothetical protein CBLAS_0310 [Campylobacter blaseri]|uniref:SPOR domain-containing protein n=1 Tax=Campylobacter blaseri TaxID=2042961 RepID=A0A2P8R1D5_9BACT|nr:SPOR domain-containing protein [Campylobacter blaseri]PSM52310.1 SPOR domain-containing protein [Campylobacter blaseri]PSM54076.1 SPOR domain-containing protein [Campylobacter blaseri]QKF85518.1 hypothetical protein CBLAS_0310 [Campylobacter blaseri]